MTNLKYNGRTYRWEAIAIPAPYPHSLLPWLYLRLIGHLDEFGRKAALGVRK
jgi:hypothetical protein